MKLLTSAARAKAVAQYGSQPITVLKVEWPSGTAYYADSDYTFGANSCAGKILSMGDAVSISKAQNIGELSAVSVTLDDNDQTIKDKINTDLIEGTYCTVYFHFNGLSSTDAVTLLRGRIQGDISYDQATRQLNFTIDANTLIDQEVGFSTTRLVLTTMSVEAETKAWPLCYGTVLKVPALHLYKPLTGKTQSTINNASTYVVVENGSSWPQGVSTDIQVASNLSQIRHRGTFAGNIFTFTSKNLSYATNVACAARVFGDADYNNSSVFWLASATISIAKTYACIVIGPDKYVNFIWKQEGAKCYCQSAWRKVDGNTNLLLDNTNTINDCKGDLDPAWGIDYVQQYKDTSGTWRDLSTTKAGSHYDPAGSTVWEVTGTAFIYVANLLASNSILGVYAYRTYAGQKTLQAVPTRYYTKNLAASLAGKTCTTITLPFLLSWIPDEKWEDDIYVSLVSSVGSNTSDQIKHILQTYSSVTVDTSTFDSVKTKITNYPSNFALLDNKSVVSALEDICYQARLGLLISSNIAYLSYLSQVPTPNLAITEDLIKLKSLSLGFTKTEEIVTKYTAKWQPDYTTNKTFVYGYNQNVLGTKAEEKDFYIYNIESLVKLSARFWGWRLANSWRQATYQAYLPALGLEVFDTVNHTVATLSTNDIRGQVTGVQHNTDDQVLNIQVNLASLSGQSTSGQPIEAVTYYTGDPAYPITGTEAMPADPGAGLAEIDYTPAVDVNPDNQVENTKYAFTIEFDTNSFQRGVAETVTITFVDDSGRWIGQTVNCDLIVASDDSSDVLSVTTVTLTNGQYVGGISISGGTGIDNATINASATISKQDVTGISKGFKIQDEGTITWTTQPFSVVRGKEFTVGLTGGAISAVYAVSVTQGDGADVLYNTSGAVTTITTDASGNYNASDWKFDDGDYVIDDKVIVLTRAGNDFPSESITLIDNPASPGIVYKLTGSWTLGQVLMNNGSGGWTLGDPSTATGKTLGVIALVKGGDQYLVVRGLCCLSTLLDHTTYNLGASGTTTTSAGFCVLRTYQNKLCWVGGAGQVNKLDDVGDVNTPTPTNGDVLVWDNGTSKWIDAAVSDPANMITYTLTGGAINLGLAANSITYAKIQQVAAVSVVGNATNAAATATAIAATADGQVLTRAAGALVWQTLATASITANSVTYAKIQQVTATSVLCNPTGSLADVSALQATSDNRFLKRSAGALTFGQVGLATADVTGILDVFNGGTGLSTASGYLKGVAGAYTQVATIPVADGGTGATTLTGYLKGNGTSAFTSVSTIPGSDISGYVANAAFASTAGAVNWIGVGGVPASVSSLGALANSAGFLQNNGSGTLSWTSIDLNSDTTGTLVVGAGGTGATTLTGYLKGNGAFPFTASSTIPGSDISGAVASANAVPWSGITSTPIILTDLVTNQVLPANQGGTGFVSYTVGDLLYANTATTLTRLNAVAVDKTLISAGANTAPVWGTLKAAHLSPTAGFTIYGKGDTGAGVMTELAAAEGTVLQRATGGNVAFSTTLELGKSTATATGGKLIVNNSTTSAWTLDGITNNSLAATFSSTTIFEVKGGSTQQVVCKNTSGTAGTTIQINWSGNTPRIQMFKTDKSTTTPVIDLDCASLPAGYLTAFATAGSIKAIEIDVCVSGVAKKMVVLGSGAY